MNGGSQNAYCRSKMLIIADTQCYDNTCIFDCGVVLNYLQLYAYGSSFGFRKGSITDATRFICEDP